MTKLSQYTTRMIPILRQFQRYYRSAVVKNFGEPLQIVENKDCTAGDGEIVVNVECAGINYADIQTVDGTYHLVPETPFIPGNTSCHLFFNF